MTVKLRKDSQIPAYMAYPRFLLTMDISETAKLVYVLLLDRARTGSCVHLLHDSRLGKCKREK